MAWVLEAELLAVQALRPLRTLRISENPACYVFGFDDKNALPGDDNMVDLGRPVARLLRNVVQREIDLRIEQQFVRDSAKRFAEPALDQ